jgi:predicted aldo/keto reductase-like oxidoreductase
MELRRLGRSGLDISCVSIGAMRLPKDDQQAVALVRHAIDRGCNYIDTSIGYPDSERKLGLALQDGYRAKVHLSTKSSPWIHQQEGYTASADDARRKIDEQMRVLQVDYLDFYQVWNITDADSYRQAIEPGGMVDGIHRAMEEGLVRHIGATTHAPREIMLQAIDSGLFESMTFSYFLLNRELEDVLEHAHRQDVGVVIMNPVGGGMLTVTSDVIQAILPEVDLSTAGTALRFVLDNPHVTTAICGFERASDVDENVRVAGSPGLTAEQRARLVAGVSKLEEQGRRVCTQCGYCMPCEQGVLIKDILKLANNARLFGLLEASRARYRNFKPEQRADACTQCGACEEKCTNNTPIREELAKAHQLLMPDQEPG